MAIQLPNDDREILTFSFSFSVPANTTYEREMELLVALTDITMKSIRRLANDVDGIDKSIDMILGDFSLKN